MTNDYKEFEGLSEEERQQALKILQELSQGNESSYNKLLYDDYEEIPVDIETFLTDDRYLGLAWKDAAGKSKIYPFWMDKLKELFPTNVDTNYNTVLESGARGIGKAQPLTSPVFSKYGYIPMGDVKVGTEVYGRDGKLHKVIAVFPQGLKPVYKIKFSDNTETLCSDEHLWKVIKITSHDKESVLTLNEIIKDGLTTNRDKNGKFGYKYKIPMCEPIQFIKREHFISPYILGCIIGDGGTHYNDGIKFTSTDEEIINNLNKELEANGYILSKYSQYAAYGIKRIHKSNNSNKYVCEIKKLGLNCKSEHKFIPQEYLFDDIDSRIALLQGLMDTDGYCAKNGYCTYSTSSEQLKDDFVTLIQSLGGTAPWRVRDKRRYKNKNGEYVDCLPSYEITVNLPAEIKPFRLTRKLERILKTKHKPSRTIHSIEYVGEQECQCILLNSEEHLYLTNDLIVTHNSEIACGVMGAYLMHRIMCLKNPLEYYHLKLTEKICFAFMNIKLSLAEEIAVSKFQKTIQMSPWFMSKGTMTKRNNLPYWNPPEPISIIIGSQSDDVIGKPIFFAFFDEISFIRNQDIDKQKKKAKDMVDTAIGGMFTRFIHNGKNPTLLAIASSKRSEQSFMEEYIRILSLTEGNNVLIIDKPVWEVKPKGTYSETTFNVGLGNKFLESIVINDGEDLQSYIDKGYRILKVPIDFKAKFLEDIDRNLCDFAGVSSSSLNKYMSAGAVSDVIDDSFANPMPDIIEVGNAKDDIAQYCNFFNLGNVPKELMEKPLFIHLDMSISGDMTGIAGVWISGKKPSTDSTQQAKDLSFRLAFSFAVKAPKGRQISFEKNRNFIRWLKAQGFRIKEITSDTFQSYDLQQQLTAEGYKCSILSVDRVDTDRICKPYQYLKSTIYEKRLAMYRSSRLFDEFVDIERNIDTGKIDHTPNAHKDILDAVCGAVFTASKYAEEYAYDYGESLDLIENSNNSQLEDTIRQQITIDLEETLKETLDPISHKKEEDHYLDFGFGKAQMLNQFYVSQGIII